MRKNSPELISDVLKSVVEGLSQTKEKGPAKILSSWASVAGKELARHTRPAYLKNGALLVFVDESAWFYEASLKKDELIRALNKKMKKEKIQTIQFRIGSIKK